MSDNALRFSGIVCYKSAVTHAPSEPCSNTTRKRNHYKNILTYKLTTTLADNVTT